MIQKLYCNDFFVSTKQTVAIEPRIPQHAYPEHTHDFNEIVIVTRGQGLHILNGRPYELHAGMFFYIQAADHHLYEHVNDLCLINILYRSPTQFTFLSNIEQLLPNHRQEPDTYWYLNKKDHEKIQKLLHKTCTEEVSPTVTAESLFLQLLINLQQGRYPIKASYSKENRVQQLLYWLKLHFVEDINWPTLAQQFDLPLRTLYRYIKNHTSYSPQCYLMKLRLSEAYYQICYTDKDITTIAYDCGFNNSGYFSTCFKKQFDIIPSKLRCYSTPKKA